MLSRRKALEVKELEEERCSGSSILWRVECTKSRVTGDRRELQLYLGADAVKMQGSFRRAKDMGGLHKDIVGVGEDRTFVGWC